MKVHLWPEFSGEDEGDGGIRRVVEGQLKALPRQHVSFVENPGDADVIACHTQIPDEYFARFPDKPIVVHCHGLYWAEYEWQPWAYKANREVLKAICSADAVTAPTEWVAEVIRRHTSRPVYVVPHGIHYKEWRPAEHRGYVLWNKTRVDPVCEVESLNILATMCPDIEFVSTFGDPAPNVHLTGKLPKDKAKELVRHAEVYLCTTRETFGIGTLEAMAAGVPVVGYRFGGQEEYIEHMKDGYLADPGDFDGLRRGIEWARANREKAGAAARAKALQFSWENAAKSYAEIYRSVQEVFERHEDEPRVTIVVPAYNLAKYLPDTLRSIQQQTDPNWECIVVDDASPDTCGDIAESFAEVDDRFRVIHNAENLYLAGSRNVAIEQARGRYILPVDADDMIAPQTVATLADALDSDRTLQTAYGRVFFVDEDGRTPTNYRINGVSPGHSTWPVPFDPWKQIQGQNLQPYCSMFRRSAWEAVGGYRTRLRTSEDADFWTRLASYGFRSQMVTQADTLIYRNREGSMSREHRESRWDYLKWYLWTRDHSSAPAGLAGERKVSLIGHHVTVVIPVGPGHERIVQDAVDSVGAQTYPHWECIVVNDTGAPLLLPAWVRVIESNARDTAAARNIGIAAAKGSLFLPLDADDYLQPQALELLVNAYIEREGDCIIYPDMFEDPEKSGEFRSFEFPDWSCEAVSNRMVHAVTALTPVHRWREVGGYTEGMLWEDWDFQLKLAEIGVCSYRLAAPLFTYRKWTGTRRAYGDREELDRRLAQINERWGEYRGPERTKHFMACSCSGKTVNPAPTAKSSVNRQTMSAETVLVQYTGNRAGSVRYRGKSGAYYTFAAGDEPSLVALADVQLFASLPDFRVLPNGTPSEVLSGDPILVA